MESRKYSQAEEGRIKMKSFLRIFTMMLLLNSINYIPCLADTFVSGTITSDTTWTKANSPYIVTGSVLVAPGVTLNIEPGVMVKFNGPYFIFVDGTLKAIGTKSENITFTTNNSGQYWGYIHFRDASIDATYDIDGNYVDGCILQYCIVEYAEGLKESTDGAIKTNNASPFINFCTIRFNKCRGINFSGTNNIGGISKITNSLIHNNLPSALGWAGGGIKIFPGSGYAICSGNVIMNNESTDDGGGIYSSNSDVRVLNNFVINNIAERGGGIFIAGNATGAGMIANNNIISNNIAKTGGGIYSTWAKAFSYNHIVGNTADDCSGIYSNSKTNIQHNLFHANKSYSANPSGIIGVINGTSYQPILTINYNNILNNSNTYSVKQLERFDCNFENNWWNTTAPSQIGASIFDKLDDASLGLVDFLPYAEAIFQDVPISPPQNVQISLKDGKVNLTWSPNPEPDTAGYRVYWGKSSGYPYDDSLDVGKVTSYSFTNFPLGAFYFAVTAYDNDYNPANDNQDTLVNENQTAGHESWFSDIVKVNKTASLFGWLPLLLD